ncbi:hypothetical protein QOZ95_004287 [Paenibacillus brasilensis]|uniref:Uncharacterized protein n=1 Tax=Paenibacillus brasilensis TaxID=128574 RepID=A0ABU0L487_9BACL|nr:hypothetical protein [Paenibacillus brasilensis]
MKAVDQCLFSEFYDPICFVESVWGSLRNGHRQLCVDPPIRDDMGIRPVHGLMSRIGYISLEHKE